MKKTSKPKNAETATFSFDSGSITEEQLGKVLRKATSLKDIPTEQRRKEASEPLYLTRYE
jgi:hypothetical protein